jgi:hypothetical protein
MRILALLICVVLAALLAAWLLGGMFVTAQMQTVGTEPWPAGLGTLASVEKRVQPQATNDAARMLITLAAPLEISFDKTPGRMVGPEAKTAITEYVRAEQLRADGSIAAPPPLVTSFLATHEKEIDAVRDHLLRDETIAWEVDASRGLDAPLPNLLAHMQIARLLSARALDRGRANDARAWEDLHATWRLAEGLKSRPEMISQLIVLGMARSINGVAWKLPTPTADLTWFRDLQQVDHRLLLLAGSQYDAWAVWKHGERTLDGMEFRAMRPALRWGAATMARAQRRGAEEVASMTACNFDEAAFAKKQASRIPKLNVFGAMAMPNLGALWQRAFRSIPEREGTMNAMRIAQGQPIVAKSACSDGEWRFAQGQLSFSGTIAPAGRGDNPMPLSLAIPARATRQSI